MTITQIQPISVVFTLPQKDIPEVQAAMAKGTLKTLAYDQDDRTVLDEGSLLLVNNTISQILGNRTAEGDIPEREPCALARRVRQRPPYRRTSGMMASLCR